jgi:3-hydroxyisobutyrate dehydrogenase-like beta-hydroxyacid dehydrogenase
MDQDRIADHIPILPSFASVAARKTTSMPEAKPALCFIGFGEAGQAIAAGLRKAGFERICAWDILFPRADGGRLKHAADALGVGCASSPADAVRDADIVISAVTAASSIEAVRSVAPHLHGKPFLLDINSVSPGRKQEAAKLLGDTARYVDVAVIAPIHPARHQTPMLIAGPHAEAEVGAAAAIKMVRSIMVKGIEALTLECFLAAARAGVVDEVATSLKNNYPGLDWSKVVAYNLERMASHGERRAAEMEEVADTLRELGVEPLMTSGTIKRQREMGEIGSQQSVRGALKKDRAAMLNAISTAARDRH